jgi:hypothetical protein
VAADPGVAASAVLDGVADLAAKSLVAADVSSAVVRYRLLDTTRAYALQKLTDSGELEAFVRRHAEHHRDLFERAETEWEAQSSAEWLAEHGPKLDDVRSALNWAFSTSGEPSIGVALTAASLALWMHLSLFDECRRYVERALAALRQMPSGDARSEMRLRSAHAASLMSTKGAVSEVKADWEATLEIAESLDDAEFQLRALRGLCAHRLFVGEYRPALELADRFRALAAARSDLGDRLVGERMLALARHYLGDQSSARSHIERMLASYVTRKRAHLHSFSARPRRSGARSIRTHTVASGLSRSGDPRCTESGPDSTGHGSRGVAVPHIGQRGVSARFVRRRFSSGSTLFGDAPRECCQTFIDHLECSGPMFAGRAAHRAR